MPYLGSAPTTSFQTLAKQDFTTSATTNYTLSNSVTSANDIALFINNVRQEPTAAYSASGTALTLSEATAGSDDMYCVYIGRAVGTINPASGSVGTSQLVDGSVSIAKLSATGTASSSTFLRGDNSFAEAGGGKVLQVQSGALTTHISTTSTSYVAVTNCSITFSSLASTSSKVLLLGQIGTSGNHDTGHMPVRFARSVGGASYSAVGVGTGGATLNYTSATYSTNGAYYDAYPLMFLDSPSTTSATIYRMEFRSSNGATQYINRRNDDTHFCGLTTIIGLEIGA